VSGTVWQISELSLSLIIILFIAVMKQSNRRYQRYSCSLSTHC